MCRGLGDPDQPAKGGRLPRAGTVEMSLDKCVQVYEKGRWGAGGKSVAGRRSSTCKGRWGGGSGTQGAGAELQRVFFASSCPGPVPPFLCSKGLGWGCLESAPGSTTCRRTASLSAQPPTLSPSAPGGSSPVPRYFNLAELPPAVPGTWPLGRPGIRDGQSQNPIPLARASGPRMSTWPGAESCPVASDGQ